MAWHARKFCATTEALPPGWPSQRRIQAEDIIINIGKDATPPAPPAGHSWKAVIHNQYVSWLAGWKDSINTKDWKCAATFSHVLVARPRLSLVRVAQIRAAGRNQHHQGRERPAQV